MEGKIAKKWNQPLRKLGTRRFSDLEKSITGATMRENHSQAIISGRGGNRIALSNVYDFGIV